ncbi:MAG: pathogenicity locus [Firmicutes bacterium]|nr:pathogenicity locus [Bacillota bacterium]
MADQEKERVLKDLRRIPGVGKSIADDLWRMGFRSVEELKQQDPEEMYLRFCHMEQALVDRCLLYVFRGAVYFASNEEHDPELLKWWNWKDDPGRGKTRRGKKKAGGNR